jgi:transcriptional regulator with XRE-family HTH domain
MDRVAFRKDIAHRLKELRGSRTQESIGKALCEVLGEKRTKEAYQHYEGGRRLLPSDVLWGLSKIYGVSADWILTGKEPSAARKEPEITRFHKDIISIAELAQSLSKEQKEAIKVIFKSLRPRKRT